MSGAGGYFSRDSDTDLFLDNLSVDLSCRDVVFAREGNVQVSLVVSKVQIDLSAVVKDVDLTCGTSISGLGTEKPFLGRTMLLRSHGPRIYVHIGINLNGSNLQTCHLEQQAGRGG